MTTLGPDEKVCPYCAETIKAAAVKCRYCHSDLTDAPAAQAARSTPPAPKTSAPKASAPRASAPRARDETAHPPRKAPAEAPLQQRPTAGETSDASHPGEGRTASTLPLLASFRLLRILVAVCLVLAALTAVAWWFDREKANASGQGPITSVQARDAGIEEATRLTEKILSYDWKSLTQDTKAAEAVMGPSFRTEYAKAMARVEKQTLKNQVRLEAKAVATSIVSASDHKVVALVFVNQVTTAKGTKNQRLDQNRVLVTLTRGEGEWRVSKMDAF